MTTCHDISSWEQTPTVPSVRFRHIVVGIDGSDPSRRALEWARFMAVTTGATVEAVSVWHVPAAPVIVGTGLPADAVLQDATARVLHDTVTAVLGDAPGVSVRELVGHGSTARVLLGASKDAQLLVVGSRGHGGFTGLLLGSVSSACAEHARCPVLVVHGDTPPPPVLTAAGQ